MANPNYWGKKPQIKKITQDGIDDSGSRLQLLLTGVADYAEELTPLQLDQVARSSGAAATNFTSTRVAFLAMNNNKPPFNTPALRQAIARAIPYNDIIKTVYRGRAKRWKTLITPWFQGATDQYWKYETNLAAARAQLASVKGMQVTLSYVQGFGAGQQIAILVQKGLNAAGLNCQLEGLLRAVADQRKVQGGIDFFVDDSDSPAVPSPLYNLQLYFTTTSFQNTLSHYQNPDIDKLAKSLAKNPNSESTVAHRQPRAEDPDARSSAHSDRVHGDERRTREESVRPPITRDRAAVLAGLPLLLGLGALQWGGRFADLPTLLQIAPVPAGTHEDACGDVLWSGCDKGRLLFLAVVDTEGTARSKDAPVSDEEAMLSSHGARERLHVRVDGQLRAEQELRVGMRRAVQHLGYWAFLDQPAVVHHGDAIADAADRVQVVGDEQEGEPQLVLEPEEQAQDLCPHRDVQR